MKYLLALVFGMLFAAFAPAQARDVMPAARVSLSDLPAEARETLALIKAGGPFPYKQDGTAFGNREKLLPARERGYYREYTVPTPGARDRGGRRIVTGGAAASGAKVPVEYWYTGDHYKSFRRIRE